MLSGELVIAALLALNAALYASLAYAAFARRRRMPEPTNLSEAFGSLELALKGADPYLPAGFTWEEAAQRLRSRGMLTEGMEGALKSYEAYRYGGAALPETDYRDVVSVTKKLWRRGGLAVAK